MLNFGFKRKHNGIPRDGLLLYLGRPNLEAADVPLGDDTEIGDDTIIKWKFLLPADADIRAATGWVSGVGNIFYDAAGDPIDVFASEIAAWADINRYNVLFHLVSSDTETGRLAIYALDASHETLNKARRVLREDQYNYWAPLGAILHYDVEVEPPTELVGGVHTLNHSILAPQYQLLADGSYIDVGAQPAVDTFEDGLKGLRSCGDLTNLLPGDTSIARSVTLTAQTYTLQVFGAGSASCSYGTATVGAPLTFTATAGTTTFTPSGAALWMLTATAYPTPYVPPGVTQPASNATTTNGTWFALPDGSPMWQALTGAPLTLATRIRMSVGSADLTSDQLISFVACQASSVYGPHLLQRFAGPGYNIVRAHDGGSAANKGGSWSRNAVVQRFTQVNEAGTRFRVGYVIEGTYTAIQWSHASEDSTTWATFDGSFNPSTLYRLMLGYNNSYPMWFNKITVWKREVPVAELEAWV